MRQNRNLSPGKIKNRSQSYIMGKRRVRKDEIKKRITAEKLANTKERWHAAPAPDLLRAVLARAGIRIV
jgi:hypothetical protein